MENENLITNLDIIKQQESEIKKEIQTNDLKISFMYLLIIVMFIPLCLSIDHLGFSDGVAIARSVVYIVSLVAVVTSLVFTTLGIAHHKGITFTNKILGTWNIENDSYKLAIVNEFEHIRKVNTKIISWQNRYQFASICAMLCYVTFFLAFLILSLV